MRRFATVLPALLAVALLAPAGASARVVLVATGDGTATLTDVATNQIVARIPVGGRSRAAGAAPGGSPRGGGARPRGRRRAGRLARVRGRRDARARHRPRHAPAGRRREPAGGAGRA